MLMSGEQNAGENCNKRQVINHLLLWQRSATWDQP